MAEYTVDNINGAGFTFSSFRGIETVSLGVFLRVGARFEKKKVKGIAHFTEHMVFKGSKKYSYRKIKQEIEGRGGVLNAFTSQEITAYYAHFLKKNTKYTLDILLDMVYNPLFRKRDVDKERKVILEEIKMYNDLPAPRAVMLLDQLVWEGHPLGEEVIGYEPTVENIGSADLHDFKNKYYLPKNTVVSFSGDISRDEIAKLLKARIRPGPRAAKPKTSPPLKIRGIRVKCESKPLQQSHLCLGFRSASYLSRERLGLQLINIILGANMSSRLFENLREKKSLCYDVSTEVRKYRDSGAFVVHVGLDKGKILTAIRAICKELTRIKRQQIPDKEISRAKDYLIGQTAMSFERPEGRMFHAAQDYIRYGRIYGLPVIQRKIEEIKPRDLLELSRKTFDFSSVCVSCVGDIGGDFARKITTEIEHGH